MQLVLPSSEYKSSYIDAVREFIAADGVLNGMSEHHTKTSVQELESDFETFVARKISESRGENLPPGFVPATTYWLIEGDRYIGRVSIRHTLNENLLMIGGHIGYDIRPSERGKGYGTQILALTLQKAKELGINHALLTCKPTNTASRKIIEKNGGVLENRVVDPKTKEERLRFWISLLH